MKKQSDSKLFVNATLLLPHGFVRNAALFIDSGQIALIAKSEENLPAADEVIDVRGRFLVPGFIDVHVHGGGGYDVMAGEAAAIDGMSRFHASKGTTSLLATTITGSQKAIEEAIKSVVSAMEQGTSGAEVLGVHLEGPFLNVKRCGAQAPQHIRPASMAEFNRYLKLGKERIRLMTIAPEAKGAMDVISAAISHHVTVSIGHSDAAYDIVKQAVDLGASHVTHLFNGMSPLHHREPGVAGSALMLDELAVELICDGIHIHPDIVAYVLRTKPAEQVVLITDCIQAGGCADGEYQLGPQQVILKDGQIRLVQPDGSLGGLAGSSLTMDQALRNVMKYTGLPLERILPCLTINPARQIGMEKRKGSIEIGKDADLVILDEQLQVLSTYVKGRRVFGGEAGQ